MPKLSQLRKATETAVIDVSGIEITVTYAPNKMVMRRMSELQRLANSGDVDAVAAIIPEIVDSWDIEGPFEDEDGRVLVEDGEVAPVTPEVIGAFPAFFTIDLSSKLQELVADGPNPTKAKSRSRKR